MSHQTEIIEYRKLSDSEFAILLRCCDPCDECKGKPEINYQCKKCHLHWHTMHSSVVNDEMRMADSIRRARFLASDNHAATLKAEEKLKAMLGSKEMHD